MKKKITEKVEKEIVICDLCKKEYDDDEHKPERHFGSDGDTKYQFDAHYRCIERLVVNALK